MDDLNNTDLSKLESLEPLVLKSLGFPGGQADKEYKFYIHKHSNGAIRVGVEESIIGRDEIGPPRYPEQEEFIKQFKVQDIWYSRYEFKNTEEFMPFYDAVKPYVVSIEYQY